MSEEIDKIEGICQDCMYLGQIMPIIKQSQRKIEQLEMTLRGTTHCFDEEEHKKLIEENKKLKIQLYSPDQVDIICPVCNEKITVNYSRDVYDLKQENEELNNILTEFEKWLEEEINNRKIHYDEPLSGIPMTIIDTLKFCLDKLQELKKEGKK